MPFAAALLGHGILLTHGNRDVVGDIAQLLDSGRASMVYELLKPT